MDNKKNNYLTKTWVVCLLAFVCSALWGSAFPCVKIGYEMFNIGASDTSSQILFAGIRFIIAGILALSMGSIMQKKLLVFSKKQIPHICILSLFQTVVQYLLFYVGLAHTTGAKASIDEAANVFVCIAVSALVFKLEMLTAPKIIGCVIGFVGIIIVNLGGLNNGFSFTFLGDGLILLSTVAYAFSSVCMKKWSVTDNPVMLSSYQFIFGGAVMILSGLLLGGKISGFDFNSVSMLLYLALISAVAYSLWSTLLKYNPVSKVAVFGFMNPMCGVILSAVLLGEISTLGWQGIVALALVCSGIYVVNRRQKL